MTSVASAAAGFNAWNTLAIARSTKSGSTITATVNGTNVTVQVARDLTVSVGDPLLVTKIGSQWVTVQRLYTSAIATTDLPINPVLPNPKPGIVTGALVCAPVETRSYRATGWRTDIDDVFQGMYGGQGNHTGCAFFGLKPQSLAGATVTDAKLRVRRLAGGSYNAQPSTLRLVTESTRPVGAPTLTSSTTGPDLAVGTETSEFDVPNSWAQGMVDGTSGGLAVFVSGGTPYLRFAGKGAWSAGWTLTIYWQRG